MDDWVAIGRFLDPWGIKGCVKVLLYNEDSDLIYKARLVKIQTGLVVSELEILRAEKKRNLTVVSIRGFTTPEAVKTLRGKDFFVPISLFDSLEEGEFYVFSLLRFEVFSDKGELLGVLENVDFFSEVPLLSIRSPQNKQFWIPWRPEFVKQVLKEEKKIVVELIEGLID